MVRFWLLFILVGFLNACGEVKHVHEETPPTYDPGDMPVPTEKNGDGSPKYVDGLFDGPNCVDDGNVRFAKGRGFLLRPFESVLAKSQTADAVKWQRADTVHFLSVSDRRDSNDFAVFESKHSSTISWEIEWHHEQVNENLVKIGYTMTRADTLPFIVPISQWKGTIQLLDVARGVTGFMMENYIGGRPSCEDANGAINDIFNNLH